MRRRRGIASWSLSGIERHGFVVMTSNHSNLVFGWLAGKFPGSIGHLYSPGGSRGPWSFLPYALDNGAFGAWKNETSWDFDAWVRLLDWAASKHHRPLWALVPDVVGEREATIDSWHRHWRIVARRGLVPAFAVQDGMTFADVPRDDVVLFLGGSTEWKVRSIRPWCRRFPGRVHVGRVSGPDRLKLCYEAGAISVDGNGWHNHSRGHMSQLQQLVRFIHETRGNEQ